MLLGELDTALKPQKCSIYSFNVNNRDIRDNANLGYLTLLLVSSNPQRFLTGALEWTILNHDHSASSTFLERKIRHEFRISEFLNLTIAYHKNTFVCLNAAITRINKTETSSENTYSNKHDEKYAVD